MNKYYTINDKITQDVINEIITNENKEKEKRNFYTKDAYIANFKSALNKYLKFINSDFNNQIILIEERTIKEINSSTKITITEKKNLTLSRVGQGNFRNQLIEYWNGCSISKFDKVNLLIASHIKPWRNSNNYERLDVFNGLLLLPNYDKVFDKGYITFDTNGKIKISKFLELNDKKKLNINESMKLLNIDNSHKEYLKYHNENCFIR